MVSLIYSNNEFIKQSGASAVPSYKYIGLSTDTKPTEGIINGTPFYEMDTGKTYFFDATPGLADPWITIDAD